MFFLKCIERAVYLSPLAAIGFSCRTGEVRLVGGNSTNEGRVEVCISNTYWTVCDDRTWGVAEAKVVCNQLNFGSTGGCKKPPLVSSATLQELLVPFSLSRCLPHQRWWLSSRDRKTASWTAVQWFRVKPHVLPPHFNLLLHLLFTSSRCWCPLPT